jgi:uncharacterized membrane protein HdeD (DUF308 family)
MSATAIDNKPLHMPWWIPLIQGIAAVILGILLWTNPAQTAVTLVTFLAIYWIIAGVMELLRLVVDRSHWGWKVFSGLLGILAGWALLRLDSLQSALLFGWTVVILLAIQGIIMGIAELIEAFRGGGWGPGIMGALSILFGVLLWSNSIAATVMLPWVIAIFMIVGGIAAIVLAFRLKGAAA